MLRVLDLGGEGLMVVVDYGDFDEVRVHIKTVGKGGVVH